MTNWLKKIVLGFFLIIFIIGFFSQSIINYFIPKVYLEDIINSERLEKSIYLTGTLEPKESVSIKLGRDVVIDEFYFVPGSYIKEGLALFKINSDYGIEDLKALSDPIESTINALEGDINLIDEKLALQLRKISDAKIDIQRAIEESNNYNELYKTGAVSHEVYLQKLSAVDTYKRNLDQLQVDYDQLQYQKTALETSVSENKRSLDQLSREANFLSNVDDEGVYYSEYNGVIMNQAGANILLDNTQEILEIAKVNSYSDVYLKMFVDEDTMKYLNLNKSFFIEEAGREDPDRIQIVYKSYKTDNNLVEVRGEYKDRDGIPFLGRAVNARLYIRSVEHNYIVPKSAIRTATDSYDDSSQSFIFTVMEENTILGQEQVAHAVEVLILDEGDNYVAIESLADRLFRMQIIANLTYEIEDNARVLIVDEE